MRRTFRVGCGEEVAPLGDKPPELVEVEPVAIDLHRVAGWPRLEDAGAQHLTEARDVNLEHLRGGRGHALAPEIIDQALTGDGAARVQQQVGQQGALLRAPEPDRVPLVVFGFHWPEDPEL